MALVYKVGNGVEHGNVDMQTKSVYIFMAKANNS